MRRAECRRADDQIHRPAAVAREGGTRSTWYEPLEAQADIDLAVWWVLGRPGVFLNTAGDVEVLPRVLDAAERFEKRPTDAEIASMLKRAKTEPLFV